MTPSTRTAPAITERQFWAAAAALLAISILAVYPSATANADGLDTVAPAAATMHDGVDWSRVPLTPVDTGATVGAYAR